MHIYQQNGGGIQYQTTPALAAKDAEIARLRAEVEAYRKDAERWQHVRDMDPDAVGPAHHVVECGTDSWGNPYYEYVTGDEADQVIDAAMGASA